MVFTCSPVFVLVFVAVFRSSGIGVDNGCDRIPAVARVCQTAKVEFLELLGLVAADFQLLLYDRVVFRV